MCDFSAGSPVSLCCVMVPIRAAVNPLCAVSPVIKLSFADLGGFDRTQSGFLMAPWLFELMVAIAAGKDNYNKELSEQQSVE